MLPEMQPMVPTPAPPTGTPFPSEAKVETEGD